MRISSRDIINLALIVLLSVYVVTAMKYNPQARLMPIAVSVPILVLAIWQTYHDFKYPVKAEKESRGETSAVPAPAAESRLAKDLKVSLWIIALFVAIYLFGFVFTTFLYTFVSLKVRSRYSWRASLGVSVSCLAFLYFVMVYALKVELYPGSITLVLRKAFYGY